MKTQYLTKDTRGEIVIYQSEEGRVSVDVLFQDETVWLPIEQMSILFGKSRSTINEHILNIYKEGELSEADTMRKIGISDFSTKPTNFYNLDVVISVGYRVHSVQGTRFRQWATQRIHEYIIKGYTLDDERLKGNGGRYFRELLQRIRDIRSSERNLYQQVTRWIMIRKPRLHVSSLLRCKTRCTMQHTNIQRLRWSMTESIMKSRCSA